MVLEIKTSCCKMVEELIGCGVQGICTPQLIVQSLFCPLVNTLITFETCYHVPLLEDGFRVVLVPWPPLHLGIHLALTCFLP